MGLLLIGVMPCSYGANNEDLIKVRAEAVAMGIGDAARQTAIANAQQRILAEIVETTFSTDDVSKVASLLKEAPRYIKVSRLVGGETRKDSTRVEIECLVRRQKLISDVARFFLSKLPQPPTALVFVGLQAGDTPITLDERNPVNATLSSMVVEQGLERIDTALFRKSHTDADLAAVLQGDKDAGTALARQRFADVLIIGVAKIHGTVGGMEGSVVDNAVDVTLRIYRATDGKLMDAIAQQAVVHSATGTDGIGLAIEDVCAKIKVPLTQSALVAATTLRTTDDIIITIEEPGPRERIDALVKRLNQIEGVTDAEELLYTDSTARVRVSYGGMLGVLAKALTAEPIGGTKLEVRLAVQRDITVRFAPLAKNE